MLVIIGTLIYISATVSANANSANTSYVLATVLFYKDIKGNIRLASGPVPPKANIAIKNDISYRLSDAAVKVVSVFNESQEMPKTVNIYQLIKNQQKPVFVTEVHKRLSRNIKDWWNNLWGLNVRSHKKKEKVDYTEVTKTSLAPKQPKILNNKVQVSTGIEVSDNTTREPVPKLEVTTVKKKYITKTTIAPNKTEDAQSLEYYDNFIPNDIYYSIEQRCANWGDRCTFQSKHVLNPSQSFQYVYERPKFYKQGPQLE